MGRYIRITIFGVLVLAAIGSGLLGYMSHRSRIEYRAPVSPASSGWGLFCAQALGGNFRIWFRRPGPLVAVPASEKPALGWMFHQPSWPPRGTHGVHFGGFVIGLDTVEEGDLVRVKQTSTWFTAGVPAWFLFGLFALFPSIALTRWALRRRVNERECRKQGVCVNCNYDLTGNVSGVCPECGTHTAGTSRDHE